MLHACVRRFDVMGTVQNILGTKHGLIILKWNIRPMTDTEAHSKGSLSCKRGLSIAAYKEGRDLATIHYLHIESWKKIPHMLLLNPKFLGGRYITTHQRSHRSYHTIPHRIFGDVEERERGERKRWLLRETTAS